LEKFKDYSYLNLFKGLFWKPVYFKRSLKRPPKRKGVWKGLRLELFPFNQPGIPFLVGLFNQPNS